MLGRSTAVYLAMAIPAIARGAYPSPGTERLLVSGPGDQTEPAIASPYLAYTDEALGPGAWKIGIFSYDTGAIQFVRGGAGARHQSAVSGQIVAFTETASGYGQVWLYDLIGGGLAQISPINADQGHPTVGQDIVAWEDARSGGPAIWFRDLVSGVSQALPGQGIRPRASGKRVVYLDPTTRAVKLCDLSVATPVPVEIHAGPAESADIQGNNVAISVDVGGSPPSPPKYDLFVYTVAGQPLAHLTLAGNQVNPHISGSWVAFEDQGASGSTVTSSRVILWNYASTTPVLLAPPAGASLQILSDLDYPRTVYADDRSGNLDIYSYDPTDTGPPPPPPDGGTPDGGCGCDDDCDDRDHHGDHHDDGGHDDGDHGGDHHDGDHHDDDHHGDDGDRHRTCDDDDRDGGTSECEEGEVLAELTVQRETGRPEERTAEFDAGAGGRIGICIDAERVSSAWVTVNDRLVAGPASFHPQVTHLFRRARVPAGTSRVGATVAGKPGSSLHLRVVRRPAAQQGTSREVDGVQPNAAPLGQGCGAGTGGGVALGVLLVAAARRRRPPR